MHRTQDLAHELCRCIRFLRRSPRSLPATSGDAGVASWGLSASSARDDARLRPSTRDTIPTYWVTMSLRLAELPGHSSY
ncbi:hypothetical protein VFPFJ_09434 [Purpureocillium lilacinum]|uniref:Uncharacterized protein n=1 Tax=Purpureocillium lilacinum TaxID=33203 RepID=A0A179GUI3_PURLI|nr:hypothetical protein VFPFJ_09434 [Purpureocillium lilacinum]OAQ80980.1 hypothetical protein VFPFJ_09434 [Purpureocillium lilacinum]